MLFPFYYYKQVCSSGEDLAIEESINVIAAFLYYKGVILEIRSIAIGDIQKFERMITVACNYFVRMPFPYQA